MKGSFIGSGIGIPLSDTNSVEERSPSVTASATVSGIARANTKANYNILGQAGINYQTASWANAVFTSAGQATSSVIANPFFSARYTVTASATVTGDGETDGQGAFSVTGSATVSGTTAAQKDATCTSAGQATVLAQTQAAYEVVGTSTGTSTASAIGVRLRLYVNATNDRNYGAITNQRLIGQTITTTRNTTNTITNAA